MQENKSWARQQALKLKQYLSSQGLELTRKQCLEAVATMNGAKNWQTFEASTDGDIEVRDANALHAVADLVVKSAVFEAFPEGKSLKDFSMEWSALQARQESGEDVRAELENHWSNVQIREVFETTVQLDEAVVAVQTALGIALAGQSKSQQGTEVFARCMTDWRLTDPSDEPIPVTDRRTYELRFTDNGQQFYASMAYPHANVDALPETSPQLGLMLEINEGLPCVHLYSDIYSGDSLVTVFAGRDGQLFIRYDGTTQPADSHALATKLSLGTTSRYFEKAYA